MHVGFDQSHTLLVFFAAGYILKSLTAIRRVYDVLLWFASWAFAAIASLLLLKGSHQSVEQFVFLTLIVFGLALTCVLYRNLLPRLSEHSLLVLSLLVLYCVGKYMRFNNTIAAIIAFLLVGVPFLLSLYNAFVRTHLTPAVKLFLFLWFIVVNVSFLAVYIYSSIASRTGSGGLVSPLNSFLIGLTAFTLIANLGFLYMFVFPGRKGQGIKGRIREWKEYAYVLIQNHDDTQIRLYQTLVILLIGGGGLALNYLTNSASDGVVIPLYLLFTQSFIPLQRE